jgi:ribonuclease D
MIFKYTPSERPLETLDKTPTIPFIYIDTNDGLIDIIEKMENSTRIAIDTEADSLHHYYEKTCLLQVSFDDQHFIIDPLADIDIHIFLDAIKDKTLLFHGADYDLRMLKNSFGFIPGKPVIDTMIAAKLLNYEQLGLLALVKQVCGVTLCKSGQKSDWSRRPLTEAQITYAIDDTRFLERVANHLIKEIESQDRKAWYTEWVENVVEAAIQERPIPDPQRIWRLKGLKDYSIRELGYVRAIWHWREKNAQEADLPPFRILENRYILHLSIWAASSSDPKGEIGIKLPKNCVGNLLTTLKTSIANAVDLTEDELPTPLKREHTNKSGPKFKTLRDIVAKTAVQLNLAPQIIASRTLLESIAYHQVDSYDELIEHTSLMKWQAKILAPQIKGLFVD